MFRVMTIALLFGIMNGQALTAQVAGGQPAGEVVPDHGDWAAFVQLKGKNFGSAQSVRVFWYPNDDDTQAPLMERTATLRGRNGADAITIQIPSDPSTSGWSGDFANGVLRIYLLMPGQKDLLLAAKYTVGSGPAVASSANGINAAAPPTQPATSAAARSGSLRPGSAPLTRAGSTSTARPVTGAPAGVQVAGSQATASSQQALGGTLQQVNTPAKAASGISAGTTLNRQGPTITAIANVTTTSLTVKWQPVTGATGYTARAVAKGINFSVTGPEIRQPANPPAEMSATLTGLAPDIEYNVSVSANIPGSMPIYSVQKPVTTPAGSNPEGFKATSIGPGAVRLGWQPVSGAIAYAVQGDNLARMQTADTAVAVTQLSAGVHSWSVVTIYAGGLFNDINPSRASATINAEGGAGTGAAGHYRVVLVGLTANRSTWDNALQLDGKGDEIFVSTSVRLIDAGGNSVLGDVDAVVRSHVYGDVFMQNQPDRRPGGEASDNGGFADGSNYPVVPWEGEPNPTDPRAIPMVLWSGTLTQGNDAVIITPTLWEYDGSQLGSIFQDWTNWAGRVANVFSNPQQFMQVGGVTTPATIDLGGMGAGLAIDFQESILGTDGDRPIGMTSENGHAVFKPKTLVLTQAAIESLLSHNIGSFPKGIYPIEYQDDPKWRGDYTLYIRVERVP